MATEIASIGPVTVTYAFRSWVLVEADGRSVQRRVGSSEELGAALAALGLPPTEAGSLADRLWDARPRDARFATARPWETFWAAQGVSFGLFLFWTLVFVGVIVLIGLLLWITS
jgi:hypothetical protein